MIRKVLVVMLCMLALCSGVEAKWFLPTNWTCTVSGGFIICTYTPVFPPTCGSDINGTKVYCR